MISASINRKIIYWRDCNIQKIPLKLLAFWRAMRRTTALYNKLRVGWFSTTERSTQPHGSEE